MLDHVGQIPVVVDVEAVLFTLVARGTIMVCPGMLRHASRRFLCPWGLDE